MSKRKQNVVVSLVISALTLIASLPFPQSAQAQSHLFTPTKYACTPTAWTEYRFNYDLTAHVGVVNWYCDTPSVIVWHSYCGDPWQLPTAAVKAGLEAVGVAMQTNQTRECTGEERAMMTALHASDGVKIIVQSNGTAQTRPVYARTVANTRGAVLVERAPVGAPCGRLRLQDDDGKGTAYFNYGNGYTLCKIVGPVSKPQSKN